jgi:putative membrane protein
VDTDAGKGHRSDDPSMHWMNGWGWVMMSFGVLFWIAVIGLVVWAVRGWSGRRDTVQRDQESPREILDRRFARGELDLDTYTKAVDALSHKSQPASG